MEHVHEIADVITDMYASLGDREAFDRHLDPTITIWETDAESMLVGLGELDRLRDARAATAASDPTEPPHVAPERIRTDAFGDAAVTRYILRVRYGDPQTADDGTADTCFRVTDVLRRRPTGWRIVHHHSELLRPSEPSH